MSRKATEKIVCDNCRKEISKEERVPNPMIILVGGFTIRLEIWNRALRADLCQDCFNEIMKKALKTRPVLSYKDIFGEKDTVPNSALALNDVDMTASKATLILNDTTDLPPAKEETNAR